MKWVTVFLVFSFLLFNSCTKSIDKQIIGTWTDVEGTTWVFDSNGKLAYANRPGDSREYRYSVFDGERRAELTIFDVDYSMFIARGITDQKYTMEFSEDGKTLRLTGAQDLNGWRVAGPGMGSNELTRQANTTRQARPVRTAFTGTWTGVDPDGDNISVVVEGTTWTMSLPDNPDWGDFVLEATYNGNTAILKEDSEVVATATVSRNSLTIEDDWGEFTLTLTRK